MASNGTWRSNCFCSANYNVDDACVIRAAFVTQPVLLLALIWWIPCMYSQLGLALFGSWYFTITTLTYNVIIRCNWSLQYTKQPLTLRAGLYSKKFDLTKVLPMSQLSPYTGLLSKRGNRNSIFESSPPRIPGNYRFQN